MTQQKIKELKQSLNIEFQLIHELCIYVLSASQRTDLIRVTLATLHAFLSWIPLGYIFESPLLETLLKFFSLLPYRNLTFQCLAEVAALNFGYYYNPQYVNMYSIFMLQLQTILPSIVKIPEIYAHGSSEDQAFIQNLALFFTSFFKCHIRVLESTQAIYSFVFAPVEEEMGGDASYLVSIVVEFLRSSNMEKVKVHPNVHVLTVRLLARNERYSEFGLFITNKILEPSKEVALQLLESGRQNSPTRKLGLDMLRQLSLHHDYVVLLVQNGYYLEALRYARKNKVNTVRPSLFLEAAYASNDSQHLAAVLRLFSDVIPGFRNTSDNNSYIRVLAEMSSSIAV